MLIKDFEGALSPLTGSAFSCYDDASAAGFAMLDPFRAYAFLDAL